jgi:5-methylcytosine-specific restriction endonuclease McrA
MATFRYRFETRGERLYAFVRDWMAVAVPRAELENWLQPIGMSTYWVEYFEQLSAVALVGRAVAAGRSLSRTYGAASGLYKRQYRSHLNEYLQIRRRDLDDLMGYALPAVEVADGEIPNGLKKERRSWAEIRHKQCYLCGTVLDFHNNESDDYGTLDHLWPSSYGGDSISQNLLPACALCNRARKANFATWAVTSVQSVFRGLNPDTSDPNLFSGPTLFALHNWAGQRYAIRNSTNLRDAFMHIGPWTEPRLVNTGEVAYFFNLRNHNQDVAID